jgi:hypothetical protein
MVKHKLFAVGGMHFERCCFSHILMLVGFLVLPGLVCAELLPENVLILVNSQSPTSRYVCGLYRQYYPEIQDYQVLELEGLSDCSGPSSGPVDEILTRQQYDACIAEPVRNYLIDSGLISQISVIVTTAGMPYRIEDNTHANVIYPNGSDYSIVGQYVGFITAASVESELTCLWYTAPNALVADVFGLENRMVNPYQGYRFTCISDFPRQIPGSKPFLWTKAESINSTPPLMEGVKPAFSWPPCVGTIDRQFNAGDIYLTCRLDGPKKQGKSAIFAVRQMLERSKRVSSAQYGLNSANSVLVLDDVANGNANDSDRVYNIDGSVNYMIYNPDGYNPADASSSLILDDFRDAYESMTNAEVISNVLNTAGFGYGHGLKVLLDCRPGERTTQSDMAPDDKTVFFSCFGVHGDEQCDNSYLYGQSGECILNLANGAVFTSLESYNAVTMFIDCDTSPQQQGRLVDFIEIGGSGAIGHAFEPMLSASIDTFYVTQNLYTDADLDGAADLTFVEAAFTGIPFLSWAEVVIGDPLMKIRYTDNPQQGAWCRLDGDVNLDGRVNYLDIYVVNSHYGGSILPGASQESYEKYNDLGDIDKDGRVNYRDLLLTKQYFGRRQ